MQQLEDVLQRTRALIRSTGMAPDGATSVAIDELSERSVSALDELLLQQDAMRELTGLGVLQPYLDNPEIEEIWINKPNELHFYDFLGHQVVNLELSAQTVRNLTYRMLKSSGRRIDRLTPFVDAALADGSRLHVVIPEVTKEFWSINIRKFRKSHRTLLDLVTAGTITTEQQKVLADAIRDQKSLLIAGATQAGKTTLMTALLNEMPEDERLVSCEDTFELSVSHNDWVAMQTRPASPEGAPEISLRELVRQALRMRPSRLVIGEVRGPEALDMLVALNSGIPGLCTIHASSAKAAIRKLLTLPLLAGENITDAFLRPTIASAFDLAVFCKREADGSRKVTEIMEVTSEVLD